MINSVVIHDHIISLNRFVVTTVSCDSSRGNECLILCQVAEKDVYWNFDSQVIYQGEGDNLTMTIKVKTDKGYFLGTQHFTRYTIEEDEILYAREVTTPTP